MSEERSDGSLAEHEDELIAAAEREASDLAVARGVYRPTPGSLPGYRIIREIGRGGMGVVYEAEQEQPHRTVALKLIRGGAFADEHRLRLFEREIETLARLQHPGIAAIHAAGRTTDGHPFFAMDLIHGVPLTRYVQREQFPLRTRLQVFRRVCEAVTYAHQRGVIHRDLKPSNILVGADGNPRILDFGLARLARDDSDVMTTYTLSGNIIGTLPYMSPEQACGRPDGVDVRADVYSLGVILYELITGKLPYDLGNAMLPEGVRIVCEQSPRKPSTIDRALRGELETITLKALEKDAGRRYQSAAEFNEDIGRYLSGKPILAHPPSTAYQLRKLAGRHKLPVALAACLLLVITAFAIVGTVQAILIAEQRDHVAAERDRAIAAESRATREAERVTATNELFRELLRAVGLSVTASTSADAPLTQAEVAHLLHALEDKIERTFPADMELNAEARASLAAAFVNLKMYEEAEEQARAALALRQAAFGPEHPATLSALTDLGWILLQARGMRLEGKLTEAEVAFQAAYDGLRAAVGEEHPETLKAAQYLALSLSATGKYEQSQALLRRTLELQRRIFGDESPETLWSLNLLARRLTRLGNVTEGEVLAREALCALAHGTGAENAHALVLGMNWLVEALEAQGRYAAAMVVRRQMIAARERLYGPADPVAQHIRSGLAFLLVRMGQYDQAEPTLRDILASQRVLLGADNVHTRFTLNYLARSLNLHGRFEEAELLCREGMESCQRLSGDDHPLTLSFTIGLATARRGLGRLEEAAALYRRAAEALAGRPKLYFPLVRAELQRCYGVCLTDLGRYDQAEVELLAAYTNEARIRGEDHESARRCVESLGALYDVWGKPDRAAECRALLTPAETIASASNLAENLIRELGAAEEIIHHLESDPSLPEAVRTRALRHVRNHVRDTETAAAVYWWFLRSPHADVATCQAALEQARAAGRLEPENGAYLRNLGAALYRVGAYEDALAALGHADEVNSGRTGASHPADVALLAMTHHQLGEVEPAQAELDRARRLMENAEHAGSEELQALLNEAETLITRKSSNSAEKSDG